MTLTPEMVERERAAFEAWCAEHWATTVKDGRGEFACSRTEALWTGWFSRAQSQRADAEVAHLVEEVAKLLSGAPFPSARSYAKAREIVDLIERAGGGV